MEYRACIRVIRALADGDAPFQAALRAPGFEAGSFADFVRRHKLMDWIGSALQDPAQRVFDPAFLEEVAEHRAVCAERRGAQIETAEEVRAALGRAGIGCMLLKGFCLGQRFYGDPARRHQADVDVLVRSTDFEPALTALDRIGFDVATDLDSRRRMAERLQHIRSPVPGRSPHAVRVRRGEARLDLHWCLRSRSLRALDEDAIWASRTRLPLGATSFETLSDDHTVMFLLLSICTDVKRGASQARQFLDLYLVLRGLGAGLDWEAFFARRAREGLLSVCVNVLAVFLVLWECGAEFPELARALESRRRLVELREEEDAVALLERPRGNAANRVWRRRVYPVSRWRGVAMRLTLDLPHTLARLRASQRFRGRLAVPETGEG